VAELPSWNDGPARTAVLEFLERVTTGGSADLVPPAARVAVLDNDGTLWCERPTYVQALFLLDRLREQADADPDLAAEPVVEALLAGDLERAVAHGQDALVGVLLRTHAGLTTDEFVAAAARWFEEARHPRFGVPHTALTYRPMLELIDALRACEFRVFVVTGGGVEFVRAVSDELYGVAREDVVGSAVELSFERREGRVELVRLPRLLGSPNEGVPKTLAIQQHIGHRPIFAAGNSAGDREMLEYTTTGPLPSLGIVVDHDDEEREYAYESLSATDPHAEPILSSATRFGWTVVSMKRDWARIFGAEVGP
jgi:phosphoserine phosphatase